MWFTSLSLPSKTPRTIQCCLRKKRSLRSCFQKFHAKNLDLENVLRSIRLFVLVNGYMKSVTEESFLIWVRYSRFHYNGTHACIPICWPTMRKKMYACLLDFSPSMAVLLWFFGLNCHNLQEVDPYNTEMEQLYVYWTSSFQAVLVHSSSCRIQMHQQIILCGTYMCLGP